MSLTQRERTILQLASQGISDYKIARKINADPPNVTRSRKNAQKKLQKALNDLDWVTRIDTSLINHFAKNASNFRFFL